MFVVLVLLASLYAIHRGHRCRHRHRHTSLLMMMTDLVVCVVMYRQRLAVPVAACNQHILSVSKTVNNWRERITSHLH